MPLSVKEIHHRKPGRLAAAVAAGLVSLVGLPAPSTHAAGIVAAITNPGAFEVVRGVTGPPPAAASPVTDANTWGIDYDPLGDRLYWTDIDRGEIRSARPDGTDLRVLIARPGSIPRGVRVDARRDRLFWVDSERDQLRVSNLASPSGSIVLCDGFVRPNDLALDSDLGVVFITDSGHDAVFRCRESAPGAEVIFDGPDAVGAWGIDVDPVRRHVFVGCHDSGLLWRMNYDGTGRTLVAATGLRVRGLRLDRSRTRLRFVDAAAGTLHEIPVDGGTAAPLAFPTLSNPRDLHTHPDGDRDADHLPDAWELAFFGSAVAANPGDDGDLDGTGNDGEFHFGGDPTRPEGSPILSAGPVEAAPGDGSVAYAITFDARDASSLEVVPVFSGDLATWAEVPAEAVLLTALPAPEPGFTRITATFDTAALSPGTPAPFGRIFFDLHLRGR